MKHEIAGAPKTLVVIPLYNHGETVRSVAEKALAEGFPVLVVDDGSTDGGLETIRDLPVLRHRLPENKGKGGAILAAAKIAEAEGFEAILTIDADGQHDPADAHLIVEKAAAEWPSLVIGARRMEKELVPASSLFGRDFSNFWVRLECGRSLPDTQSGYRLYPVDFLRIGRFFSRRYTFEIEVLVRAAWAGLPVLSASVSVYYPPGEERVSHFHKLKDNLRLSALHTCLVTRSLLPWPQRRLYRGSTGTTERLPSVLKPGAFFRALSREHSTPGQLAAAAWLGIFLGALPIIPFGIATIIYASHKVHLNKLAAVGASNLCVAPFVPLACVEVGHYLLHGTFLRDFTKDTLLYELHHRLLEWLIGSLLIGPLLGAAGAALTYVAVAALRKRKGRRVSAQ